MKSLKKINQRTQNNTLQALINRTSERAIKTARHLLFKANLQELELDIEDAQKSLKTCLDNFFAIFILALLLGQL